MSRDTRSPDQVGVQIVRVKFCKSFGSFQNVHLHEESGNLQRLDTHRHLWQVLAGGHHDHLGVRPQRVNAGDQQTAGDLLSDEAAVVVLERGEQRPALDVQRLARLLSAQRRDQLHVYVRAVCSDDGRQLAEVVRRGMVAHDPVTDGWEDGASDGVGLAADSSRENAADARHEHLERRDLLRDGLVAQVALRHDVVPRMRQPVVVDAPDDTERKHVVTGRSHWRHQAGGHCSLDRLSVQDVWWVFDLALQTYHACV